MSRVWGAGTRDSSDQRSSLRAELLSGEGVVASRGRRTGLRDLGIPIVSLDLVE
jgi:hypothetical protein